MEIAWDVEVLDAIKHVGTGFVAGAVDREEGIEKHDSPSDVADDLKTPFITWKSTTLVRGYTWGHVKNRSDYLINKS